MIAGFERPTEGQILLDGVDMAQTPPHKRNVNTVFQNYALFPHLTVEENVAFGLKYKKASKDETQDRVGKALELVQMAPFAKRRPNQLSGGQQQRVALARALILNPKVLLLDEPLGALDAKLRKRLQIELKALQEEVGITFIYVTHDQEEALTMSDRIAVMSQGRVEQVGGPKEIYESPRDRVRGRLPRGVEPDERDGRRRRRRRLQDHARRVLADRRGGRRGHDRRLQDHDPPRAGRDRSRRARPGPNRIPAIVERTVYVGSVLQVILHLATGQTIQAWTPNTGGGDPQRSGDAIVVHFPREALRVLPEGGTAVLEEAELDVSLEEK